MDIPNIEITSQNQSLTALIDWIEIYDLFVKSKYSVRAFYKKVFPSIIRKFYPNGYIPSLSTVNKHLKNIKNEGKDAYRKNTRGYCNYKKWIELYDELISSGLNRSQFYEKMQDRIECTRSNFYLNMDKIEGASQKMQNLKNIDKPVNVVSIQQNEIDLYQNKESTLPKTSFENVRKDVTLTIKLNNSTSISFESSNPEYSVAKIIATLGRM